MPPPGSFTHLDGIVAVSLRDEAPRRQRATRASQTARYCDAAAASPVTRHPQSA